MNTPRWGRAVTGFSLCGALVLSAAAAPVQTPTPELALLPGKGLAQQNWPTVVQLIEVTPGKKVVWALRDWTTLGPASSTQLLDEPGAAERGQLQR